MIEEPTIEEYKKTLVPWEPGGYLLSKEYPELFMPDIRKLLIFNFNVFNVETRVAQIFSGVIRRENKRAGK